MKLSYKILIFIVILFSSNDLFAQQNKEEEEEVYDSKPMDEYVVEDSAASISTTNDTNYLYFNDKELDTVKIISKYCLESNINKYKSEDEFQYPVPYPKKPESKKQKKEKQKDEIKNSGPLLSESLFNFLIWTLVIIVVVTVLILYFKENNIWILQKKSKKILAENKIETVELKKDGYDVDIENAIKNYNYNLAARYEFLKLLAAMDKKKIISYSSEKTNVDYCMHLMNTKYYSAFKNAAFCYDYAWYSGEKLVEEKYKLIEIQFKNLANII